MTVSEQTVRELVRQELAAQVDGLDPGEGTKASKGAARLQTHILERLRNRASVAGVGAAALGAASQPASAGSDQVGTIGTTSDPIDVEAEDINTETVTPGQLDLSELVFKPQGNDTVRVDDANGNRVVRIDGSNRKELLLHKHTLNDVSELRLEQGSGTTSNIKTGPGDGTGTVDFVATGQGTVAQLKEGGSGGGNWDWVGRKTRYEEDHQLEIATGSDSFLKMVPIDVRNITSPSAGAVAAHDGSGAIPAGVVQYDGSNWHGTSAVGQGDIDWQHHRNPQEVNNFSTMSTSYTANPGQIDWLLQWDEVVQSGTQGQVMGVAEVDPGTNESVDVRIHNSVDNETVAEQTGITSSFSRVVLGPVDYTPSTTSSVIQLLFQIKTDPGSNNSTLSRPDVSIGVRR